MANSLNPISMKVHLDIHVTADWDPMQQLENYQDT